MEIRNDKLYVSALDERLPPVRDGLIAYFPFDGTAKGINAKPIMDYSIWQPGQTGSIGSFAAYSSNNRRVLGIDPWGNETVVWEGYSVSGSSNGAGIYYSPFPIDNTKLYRMSWWEKRVTNGDGTYGRYYAGLNGYGSVNGVWNLTSDTYNTNPYFWNTDHTGLVVGEWYLVVGHVWPYTYTGGVTHSDSGLYTINGKFGNISTDYRWAPETTTGRSRTLSLYLPAATNDMMIHHTCYPRIDICDGSEPTIEDLLKGFNGDGNVVNVATNTNTTLTKDGIALEESTTNLISDPLNKNLWTGNSLVISDKIEAPDGSNTAFRVSNPAKNSMLYRASICSDNQTKSIWVRTVSGSGTIHIGGYYGYEKYLVEVTDEWRRFDFPVLTSETGGSNFYAVDFRGSGTLSEIIVWGAQLEQKPFATSFTESTRANSQLAINNPFQGNAGSIFVKCTVRNGNVSSYKCLYGNSWSNNAFFVFMNNSTGTLGNLYGYYPNTSDSHSYFSIGGYYPALGETFDVTVSWNGTNIKWYLNGNYIGEANNCDPSRISESFDTLYIGSHPGYPQIGEIHNLAIYDRQLTDNEVMNLSYTVSELDADKYYTNEMLEMEGWKHVWGGPVDMWVDDTDTTSHDTDLYGDSAEFDFDQIMFRQRYFDREVDIHQQIGNTSETCRLKESFRYYTKYLKSLPDVSGNRILFHSAADGLLDVQVDQYEFGMCYGNSWRRFGVAYYLNGSGSMYLGQYDAQLGTVISDWGAEYADNYTSRAEMRRDDIIETGRGLTPLRSQIVDVFIRKNPTKDSIIEQTENKTILKSEFIEGT